MGPNTALSDPAKAANRLWTLQYLLVAVGVLALMRAMGDPRPGGMWHSPWLLAILGSATASLLLLVWRIRAEAWQTRRPVTSTAMFTSTAFGAAVIAASAGTLAAGLFLGDRLAWPAKPIHTAGALLSLLTIGLVSGRIAIINRLLREGRELPDGGLATSEFEDWSRRRLGRWWAAEVALVASLYLGVTAFALSDLVGVLFIATFRSGQRLYVAMAHDRGLPWPERDAQRQAAAQWHGLQRLPVFEALRARNEVLEVWAAVFGLIGFLLPFAAGNLFLGSYDTRGLWIVGLMIGGIGGWPAAFIVLATRLQGRARWDDFVAYFRMRNGEQDARRFAWIALGSSLLTVVSAIGLLASVLPFTGTHPN